MPFKIIRQDISAMTCDAIVNAANSELREGGGVCGAIFAAAGREDLARVCAEQAPCPVGRAVATPGFALPAKYIIHAVGPVWQGGGRGEADLLAGAYRSALELADQLELASIAFPLLSSGIYGYPKAEALAIATETIRTYLQDHERMVYLVLFDKAAMAAGSARYKDIERYIDDHYIEKRARERRTESFEFLQTYDMNVVSQDAQEGPRVPGLTERLNDLDISFNEMLFRIIDAKDLDEVAVYKRANLDRKLFSKIRSNKNYRPSKATVLALAVAMELDLEETRDLLDKAGFSLSRSHKFDMIVEYFILEGTYDIFAINEALFAFDQNLLGA